MAGALQHEAAGAVSVLGEAGPGASLPEERGLLIAGDARDRDAVETWDRAYFSVNFAGGPDCGQHRCGDSEEIEKIVIPTGRNGD